MTKIEKTLLLKQGARLASLGVKVEAAREKLRQLAMRGVSYDDSRMQTAYASFVALDTDWKALEAEHLALRARLNAQASARKNRP